MKRLFILILTVLICLNLLGCNQTATQKTHESVIINMPVDDSVNGYRIKNTEDINSDKIDADSVTVENKTDNSNIGSEKISYCANLNSKVFHKSDCSSVKNMKEENQFWSDDKNMLTEMGYSPCNKCQP